MRKFDINGINIMQIRNKSNKTVSPTPAFSYLLEKLKEFLNEYQNRYNNKATILNIGAGKSSLIEKRLVESGVIFTCDRIDIENTKLNGSCIRNSYQCSVEDMYPLGSEHYDAAFANYVLEHVKDLDKSASEIFRVLKPGGVFIASIPNPTAPEIVISRITPLWFHKLVAGKDSYDTHYSFTSINKLCNKFKRHGFNVSEIFYRSFLFGYMEKYIILNRIATFYDGILNALNMKYLMDNVCVVFQKPL